MSAERVVILEAAASARRGDTEALASALTQRGFDVLRVPDVHAARAALAATPTDGLVVDADAPAIDVRELVESLRADPRTASLVIAALSSGEPRQVPGRREMALILTRPINPGEAAGRLQSVLVTRQRGVGTRRELRGNLAQLPLPDLLQLLSASRASGRLTLEAAGRLGAVTLDAGDLRDVIFGVATGLKALVRLLQVTDGSFVFAHGPVEHTANAGDIHALGPALFEATRQIDESTRLREVLPDPWTEIRRTNKPFTETTEVGDVPRSAAVELDRMLATPRTVAALLDGSGITDADMLAAIELFLRTGIAEVTTVGSGVRAATLDAAYAVALRTRLIEQSRTTARLLVVVDPVPYSSSSPLARALAGVSEFVPASSTPSSSLALGSIGSLLLGDLSVELYAVPADPDQFPLWGVLAADAEGAIIAAESRVGDREERLLQRELGLPVAVVDGELSTEKLSSVFQSTLGRVAPRR